MRPGATLLATLLAARGLGPVLAAATLGLGAAPFPGAAQSSPPDSTAHPITVPLGPLTAEEGSPLQRLGLTPMVEVADPVPHGSFRADLWLGYSNIFEQDSTATHNMYLDMERLIAAVTLRYGVHPRVEVGARATLESTFGGILDPVVLGLHDFLRLGSRARPDFPEGAYGQRLERNGVLVLEVERRALALDDVRFFGKWLLRSGADGSSALSLRAVVRIPTRTHRIGAQGADAGILLLGRNQWRRWHLHGMVGATTVHRSGELAPLLRPVQYTAMAGIEHPFNPRWSAVAEFTVSTPLIHGFGDRDVDGYPSNTVLGLIYRTAGGWRWEAALQEDTPPWGPSLDFTLQLGVGRAW